MELTWQQARAAADLARIFSPDGELPEIVQRHDQPGLQGAVGVHVGRLHFSVLPGGRVFDIEVWKRFPDGAMMRRYRHGDLPGA